MYSEEDLKHLFHVFQKDANDARAEARKYRRKFEHCRAESKKWKTKYLEAKKDPVEHLRDECKTGKWVLVHPLQEDDGGAYECSCCKSGSWEVDPATWKACPWCTALMEADNES